MWQEDAGRDLVRNAGDRMALFVRGEGSSLWDADGRRYLDFLGGIAVTSLGHAHPVFVEAVSRQAATLAHVSNFFATPPQLALAASSSASRAREPDACTSATRAPRRTRPRSSSPACTARRRTRARPASSR
jgi:acetylornithine/succinyldiaminopimelate/putrescine aminotransferase